MKNVQRKWPQDWEVLVAHQKPWVMNPNIKSNVNTSPVKDVISTCTVTIFTGLKTHSSIQGNEMRPVCYRQKCLLIHPAIPIVKNTRNKTFWWRSIHVKTLSESFSSQQPFRRQLDSLSRLTIPGCLFPAEGHHSRRDEKEAECCLFTGSKRKARSVQWWRACQEKQMSLNDNTERPWFRDKKWQ